MSRFVILGAAALCLATFGAPAFAQGGAAGAGASAAQGAQPMGNHMGQNNMTQDQFNQLSEYADQAKRLTKDQKAKGMTIEDLLKQDKLDATALAQSMPLSCNVTDAVLAAEGPETVNGKPIDTKTYEVACSNGMGYYLISQTPEKPSGFSCFAAQTTHDADTAQGKANDAVCKLKDNADLKAMASAVMTRAGTACTVNNYRWIGVNAAAHTEFNEVACSDANGYILKTATPGSTAPVGVIPCHTAAMQGLPCKLSSNGDIVTVETFKTALAQNNVACDASNDKVRVIGQETGAQKRYVVEFQCTQHPKGLVAFIPAAGSSAKFETLDCKAASKRGVACKLTATN